LNEIIKPVIVRLADDVHCLFATARVEHFAGQAAAQKGLNHYRRAGEALLKARDVMKKDGDRTWLKRLEASGIGRSRAYQYMTLAKLPVTGTLEGQESEWRRISGNAPAEDDEDDLDEESADEGITEEAGGMHPVEEPQALRAYAPEDMMAEHPDVSPVPTAAAESRKGVDSPQSIRVNTV
jgi:hypothetical protein